MEHPTVTFKVNPEEYDLMRRALGGYTHKLIDEGKLAEGKEKDRIRIELGKMRALMPQFGVEA